MFHHIILNSLFPAGARAISPEAFSFRCDSKTAFPGAEQRTSELEARGACICLLGLLENPLSRRQERLAPLRGTESLILGSGCGGLGPPFWGQICLSSPDWPELAPSKEDCSGHTCEGQVFPGDAAPSPTALRPLPTAPVLPEDPQDKTSGGCSS